MIGLKLMRFCCLVLALPPIKRLISGLVAKSDLLLLDKLVHASMIDAAMQLPNGFKRFLHNDLSALARAFSQQDGPHVVATEGVFSMDGDSPAHDRTINTLPAASSAIIA